jgi:hypothetical protein
MRHGGDSPAIVLGWWIACLVELLFAGWIGAMASVAVNATDFENSVLGIVLGIALNMASIASGVLGVAMIWKIDANQEAKFEALQNAVSVARVE